MAVEMVAVEVHGYQVLVEFGPKGRRAHAIHKIGAHSGGPWELLPMVRSDAIRAAEEVLQSRRDRRTLIRFVQQRATCRCGHHDPCRADICPGCGEPRSS